MSLRARLVASILLALLLSFAAGAVLATWRAARAVRTELTAALAGAQTTATAALLATPSLDQAALRRIVASFDGSRHIRASLTTTQGFPLAASQPASGATPPAWFQAAIAPALPAIALPSGPFTLRLAADPANETLERWSELHQTMALLALFCLTAAAFCSVTAARAARPLLHLAAGLSRLGTNQPTIHIAETGPPEIAALARTFNTLATALQSARDQNQRLQAQSALLAEEERAGIARDLHDEVGPLLFAISAYTATIGRLAAAGDPAAILPQLAALQDATAAVQFEVRDMLGRLNDVSPHAASLADLLENLVTFWRRVQPAIDIRLDMDPESAALSGPPAETLFRIAQESLSNAIRHARPTCVTLYAVHASHHATIRITDNGQASAGPNPTGFGLAGMRARAAAAGGQLDIIPGPGWTVTASLPVLQPQPVPA